MNLEWKSISRIGIGAFLLFLCIHYWSAFTRLVGLFFSAAFPLIVGCVIAYIVNILMSFYEAHYFRSSQNKLVRKSSRIVCMLAAFLTAVVVLAMVTRLVVPELINCIQILLARIPSVMDHTADILSEFDFISGNMVNELRNIDWNTSISKIVNIVSKGIGNTLDFAVGAVSSLFSSATTLLIGFIFSIYLLLAKDRLLQQCKRLIEAYIKPVWTSRIYYVLTTANDCFHHYIVGQCMEAVILGTLCAVGMFLFRFPYAAMTGAVIGVTALIPVAGAYIGGAVGFLLILTDSPIKALFFLIYLVVLQQLEGNLIYPRVVGASIGLPGIWVLAAVTVGGGVFGIPGMLLGVPLAATLYQIIGNDLRKKEA